MTRTVIALALLALFAATSAQAQHPSPRELPGEKAFSDCIGKTFDRLKAGRDSLLMFIIREGARDNKTEKEAIAYLNAMLELIIHGL
jgi:hypothetical protein